MAKKTWLGPGVLTLKNKDGKKKNFNPGEDFESTHVTDDRLASLIAKGFVKGDAKKAEIKKAKVDEPPKKGLFGGK